MTIPANRLQGRTVLVVDDDPDTLEIVSLSLSIAGARVTSVASGADALRVLDDGPLPDVVLTDVSMPGESGYEFVERLRQRDEARGGALPAVAITAGHFDETRGDFVAYLRKPVEPQRLVEAVRAVCP